MDRRRSADTAPAPLDAPPAPPKPGQRLLALWQKHLLALWQQRLLTLWQQRLLTLWQQASGAGPGCPARPGATPWRRP